MLTKEQKRKIQDALNETQKLLDKELKYSEDLQNKKSINFYFNHIEKLNKMLSEEKIITAFSSSIRKIANKILNNKETLK